MFVSKKQGIYQHLLTKSFTGAIRSKTMSSTIQGSTHIFFAFNDLNSFGELRETTSVVFSGRLASFFTVF